MSEKKKITWKLNLFDIGLIVLVLAAVVVFAVIKLGNSATTTAPAEGAPVQAQSIRYVLQLEQVLPQAADMVEVGQRLYERTKKIDMGVVESVEITPAQTLTKNQLDGTFHFVEVPDRVDVTMTMSCPATFQPGKIILSGDIEARAGTSVRVLGPGYYGSGYILSVERG